MTTRNSMLVAALVAITALGCSPAADDETDPPATPPAAQPAVDEAAAPAATDDPAPAAETAPAAEPAPPAPAAPPADAEPSAFQKKLDKQLSFNFQSASMDNVISYIGRVSALNIVVDVELAKSLEEVPVTLKLDSVSTLMALKTLARIAGAKVEIEDEIVHIVNQ